MAAHTPPKRLRNNVGHQELNLLNSVESSAKGLVARAPRLLISNSPVATISKRRRVKSLTRVRGTATKNTLKSVRSRIELASLEKVNHIGSGVDHTKVEEEGPLSDGELPTHHKSSSWSDDDIDIYNEPHSDENDLTNDDENELFYSDDENSGAPAEEPLDGVTTRRPMTLQEAKAALSRLNLELNEVMPWGANTSSAPTAASSLPSGPTPPMHEATIQRANFAKEAIEERYNAIREGRYKPLQERRKKLGTVAASPAAPAPAPGASLLASALASMPTHAPIPTSASSPSIVTVALPTTSPFGSPNSSFAALPPLEGALQQTAAACPPIAARFELVSSAPHVAVPAALTAVNAASDDAVETLMTTSPLTSPRGTARTGPFSAQSENSVNAPARTAAKPLATRMHLPFIRRKHATARMGSAAAKSTMATGGVAGSATGDAGAAEGDKKKKRLNKDRSLADLIAQPRQRFKRFLQKKGILYTPNAVDGGGKRTPSVDDIDTAEPAGELTHKEAEVEHAINMGVVNTLLQSLSSEHTGDSHSDPGGPTTPNNHNSNNSSTSPAKAAPAFTPEEILLLARTAKALRPPPADMAEPLNHEPHEAEDMQREEIERRVVALQQKQTEIAARMAEIEGLAEESAATDHELSTTLLQELEEQLVTYHSTLSKIGLLRQAISEELRTAQATIKAADVSVRRNLARVAALEREAKRARIMSALSLPSFVWTLSWFLLCFVAVWFVVTHGEHGDSTAGELVSQFVETAMRQTADAIFSLNTTDTPTEHSEPVEPHRV